MLDILEVVLISSVNRSMALLISTSEPRGGEFEEAGERGGTAHASGMVDDRAE